MVNILTIASMALNVLLIATMVAIGTVDFTGGWHWIALVPVLIALPIGIGLGVGALFMPERSKLKAAFNLLGAAVVSAAIAWNLSHFLAATQSVSSLPVAIRVIYGVIAGSFGIAFTWDELRDFGQVILYYLRRPSPSSRR